MTEERYNQLENIVKSLCEIMFVYSKDNRNDFMQRLILNLNEEYQNYFEET